MSNPISNLKKTRRPPLFLPEISTPTPSPHLPADNSDNNNTRNPISPFNKSSEYRDEATSSSSSVYGGNSVRNLPLSKKNNIFKTSILNSEPQIPQSSRAPFKSTIDDSDLIDEFTTNMAVKNIKKNLVPLNSSKSPTDMELMQIMMSKLKQTEAKCALLEKQNREKDKRIEILQDKVELYKKSDNRSQNDIVSELENKNHKLQQKVQDMENFLADYGLYWVGDKNQDSSSLEEQSDDGSNDIFITEPNRKNRDLESEFKCDYDLIIKNINELNSLSDFTEPKIVQFANNGAKFETSNSIKLTLYANGIALYEGPFRPFTDSLAKKFCIDIMDGYFPSELREQYPDGVVFNLIDKREILFKIEKNSVYKSKGYRLGSGRVENTASISTMTEIDNSKVQTRISDVPLTLNQLLNKLPSKVVKDGKLIDIRNDLSNYINGIEDKDENIENSIINQEKRSSDLISTTAKNTTKSEDLSKTEPQTDNNNNNNNNNLTTLRVKSLNGESSYLLKMKYTDTIKDLKDRIKTQRTGKFKHTDFDIASIYPRKIFDNLKLTLEECDLVPNSNIMIIPKKR